MSESQVLHLKEPKRAMLFLPPCCPVQALRLRESSLGPGAKRAPLSKPAVQETLKRHSSQLLVSSTLGPFPPFQPLVPELN